MFLSFALVRKFCFFLMGFWMGKKCDFTLPFNVEPQFFKKERGRVSDEEW